MLQVSELVRIPFIKSNRLPHLIGYELFPCDGRQARFDGRVMAKPAVNLKDYRCQAVIDWLEISVTLGRPTQFQHVQRLIARHPNQLDHVTASDFGPGGVAAAFTIKIQDPTLAGVRSAIRNIKARYGLLEPVRVTGCEACVDFYPLSRSQAARTTMVGVLSRHLLPSRDFFSDPLERPRFSWGRGPKDTEYVVGAKNELVPVAKLSRWPDDDKPIPGDATFYVGKRKGRTQWRVMEKLLDRQKPDGPARALEEAEKRARVEVTLNREELLDAGVDTFDDLTGLSFVTLQGRYFKFMLPTFAGRFDGNLIAQALERQRPKRFHNGGVTGLVLMDRALDELRKLNRPLIRQSLRAMGRGLVQRRRLAATFLAYGELNDMVSDALEKLGKREARALSRG